MSKPPDYASGLGELIRAHRLYMGLSREAMADKLGMAERSYTRIENNQRACPPGLLDTIEMVVDRFEHSVETLAQSSRPITLDPSDDDWIRSVKGRAALEGGKALHCAGD